MSELRKEILVEKDFQAQEFIFICWFLGKRFVLEQEKKFFSTGKLKKILTYFIL